MNFSYSAIWDDTTRLLRSHWSLISAVAGVFVFLPMLLVGYFLPEPTDQSAKIMEVLISYYTDNAIWLLLERLVQTIGSAAILLLLSARGSRTVSSVIGTAASILPVYFITVVISNLLIGAGFALFLIPGLYLLGRLGPAGVVAVDRGHRNPIRALRECLNLTRGRGWAVSGLILVVALAGFICITATTSVFGAFVLLVGLGDLGKFLVTILGTAAMTLLYVLLIVLLFAIYCRLSEIESVAPSRQ